MRIARLMPGCHTSKHMVQIQRKYASQHLPSFHELMCTPPELLLQSRTLGWSPMRLPLKEVIAVGSKDTTSSLSRVRRTRGSCTELARQEIHHSLGKRYLGKKGSSEGEVPALYAPSSQLRGKLPIKTFVLCHLIKIITSSVKLWMKRFKLLTLTCSIS